MTAGGWPRMLEGRDGELLLDLVHVIVLTRLSQRFIVDFSRQRHELLPELGAVRVAAVRAMADLDPRSMAYQQIRS